MSLLHERAGARAEVQILDTTGGDGGAALPAALSVHAGLGRRRPRDQRAQEERPEGATRYCRHATPCRRHALTYAGR